MRKIFNKIKDFTKSLNWFGAIIVFVLCALGAISNKNVTNFMEWAFLILIVGLPFSIIILFIGRDK